MPYILHHRSVGESAVGCRLLIKFLVSYLLLAMFASAAHVPVKEHGVHGKVSHGEMIDGEMGIGKMKCDSHTCRSDGW